MKNKNLFSENKTKNTKFKYFIISFSVFIVLLAVCSVLIFMSSLDFDITNLIDSSSTTTTTQAAEEEITEYSVNDLTGKSNLLFIVEAEGQGIDFLFSVATDFDAKTMKVTYFNGDENIDYNNKLLKISSIYNEGHETAIKDALNKSFGIVTDKHMIFTQSQFKSVLSLFDGFTVNVLEDVTYKSYSFNLSLEKGTQALSSDMTFNYLSISDDATRKSILCDIITGVLKPDYADRSQKLFTEVVNSCETDISVIDYSNKADVLKAYCYANDKFTPQIVK